MASIWDNTAYYFSDAGTADRQKVRDARSDAKNKQDFGVSWSSFDTSDMLGAAQLSLSFEDIEILQALTTAGTMDSYITDNILVSNLLALDLVFTDITYANTDFSKLEPHIGDTFGLDFYGKAPVILNTQAYLFDLEGNDGKYKFMTLYKELFRLSKIVEYGIVPRLCYLGCVCKGAMLGVTLSEDATQQDVIRVNMTFMLLEVMYFNGHNVSGNCNLDLSHIPQKDSKDDGGKK